MVAWAIMSRRFVLQDLLNTLAAVTRTWKQTVAHNKAQGVLLVGRRTNVHYHGQILASDTEVQTLAASHGKLFQADAQDYFFYSRGVQNLSSIPDFVVGRRAYDNWLVDHAFHNANIVLIDASRTILALHLTTGDGNKAGHHKGADNNWNVNVLNPATQKKVHRGEWDHGTTNHCPFFTLKHGADVAIRRRF